jgi:ADP-ribose pyrophosphatase YjhB (NUDIX family)
LLCGAKTQLQEIEERMRSICPDCGWVHYPQLKVSAAGLISQEGQLLLVKRANEPWQNYWHLPAGFVDFDESPKTAAEREVLEETGLQVQATKLFNAYYYDDDPRGNGILLVYECRKLYGTLRVNAEALELDYFSASQIPCQIACVAHQNAINDWILQRTIK